MIIESREFNNINLLNEYINNILPLIKEKRVKAILGYDSLNKQVVSRYAFMSYDKTITNDDGYAIVFDDNTFLYIYELFAASLDIGFGELSNEEINDIKQSDKRDILNASYYVYSPDHKTFEELSFEYAHITEIIVEKIDHPISVWINGELEDDVLIPNAFGSLTFELANGNELIFSPESADADGYMDLVAKGLQVKETRYPFSREEYDNLFKEGN